MYSRNALFYRQITAIESVLRRKFPLKKANELKPSAQTEIRYRNFRFESADQNAESNPLIPLPYDQRYRITSSQVLILAAYTAIICGRLVVNQIRKEPIIGSDNLHPHSWAEQLGFLPESLLMGDFLMENRLIEGRVNSFLIGLSLSLCVCGLPFPQISHYVIFLSFKETLHQSSM